MTDYRLMERDFIERTLKVIDQYEEIVRPQVGYQYEYEVTLLMNCLLGLMIYPQQLAASGRFESRSNDWLTHDLVMAVGEEWGIQPEDVKSAGYRQDKDRQDVRITPEKLTIRQLLRQMRNTVAHASFQTAHFDGKITGVEFRDTERENGFWLILPVERLDLFVRKLAESALSRLPNSP